MTGGFGYSFGPLNLSMQLQQIQQELTQQAAAQTQQLLGGQYGHRPASPALYGCAPQISGEGPGSSAFEAAFEAAFAAEQRARKEATTTSGVRAGEIVAWRAWWWCVGQKLYSVSAEVEWVPDGIMEGDPGLNCFGVHAFKTRARLERECFPAHRLVYKLVTGTVYLWGDIQEHEFGYRAQFAKIRSIDYAPSRIKLWLLRYRYGVGSDAEAK